MASRGHRVSVRVAWGCALVLGIGLSGCAASHDTGVSDPAGRVHFTVPGGWRPIGAAASSEMSDDYLRDILFPVTSGARQKAATQGYPLTGFRQLRDQVVTLGGGVHGVREIFDYAYGPDADTWDMDAVTDAAHAAVFLLMVHCTTACYGKYQAEITRMMSSLMASRLARPTGPFSTLIGR